MRWYIIMPDIEPTPIWIVAQSGTSSRATISHTVAVVRFSSSFGGGTGTSYGGAGNALSGVPGYSTYGG